MSVDKLKRVVWNLREKYPGQEKFSEIAVRVAIMEEIGTDPRCVKHNMQAIVTIGYLKRYCRWWFIDQGVQY